MKTKKINFLISIILIFAAFALTMPLFFRTEKVKAATPVTGNRVLPVSDIELTALDTPQNVFCLGNTIAIIENSTTLTVFKNGTKINSAVTFTDLGTIKAIDENTLYVSDNGSIYRLSISNGELNGKTALQNAATTPPENIGSDFDYNGNYLITNNAVKIITYSLNGTSAVKVAEFTSKNKSPIAINGDNTIFYIDTDSNLCKSDINHSATQTLISNTAITKIIANEEYVYYIEGVSVFRVSVNGGEPQNLMPDGWFNDGENYDLGKLVSPTGLCFKNGNLLISDSSLNAVQEFKIVNDKLEFTGFAIAESGKTAYNRIGTVKKLDRYGERVAALSDYKLTVMTIDESFDGYNKANFQNYFANETINAPTNFALGKSSLIAVTEVRKIICINLDDGTESSIEFTDGEGAIKDVTYQSGTFYVLTHNGNDYKLFSIKEKDFSCDKENYAERSAGDSVAVDVFGNQTTSAEFSDLATDLNGKVFGLKNKKLYERKNDAWTETGLNEITAYAMNFDEKTVYYADENAEHLYSTDDLDNLAISSLILPDGYSLKGERAKTVETYKITSETANVYDFSVDTNGVKFKDIIEQNDDGTYVFLAKAENADICFMASENGAVIIAEHDLTVQETAVEQINKDVYITTGVHAYCLPVVTRENLYVINRNGNDVTLDKNDRVKAKSKITLYGREFYLVTVGEENAFDCYVPAGFTVDELYDDYAYSDYRLEKVKKTKVYSDAQLTVEIGELEKNSQIRVISQENGVCKIAYLSDGEFKEGYIKSSAIINEAKISVRNVLIVLATITCACGTATYFILRKRTVD